MKEDLKVVYRNPAELIPYARNARTHSSAQIQKLASSIKEFGFTNPILLDGENGIIAGHGRLAAAQVLKIDRVPTIDLTGLTEAQKRAYILADNRMALDAGWDAELLKLEIEDIKTSNIDVELAGFEECELNLILEPHSYIDTLSEEDFSSINSRKDRELFSLTLTFPKEQEEKIKNYIKEWERFTSLEEKPMMTPTNLKGKSGTDFKVRK